jgi:peroxiredoxin
MMQIANPNRLKLFAFAAAFVLAAIAPFAGAAQAQTQPAAPDVRPALLGQPLMDFTLPSLQGPEVSLGKLKGKNVLIVFPRGYAAENYWCTICNYFYAELVEIEKTEAVRAKYNLEILFVLPYARETVQAWVDDMPAQLEKLHGWKFPAEPDKLDEKGKARVERLRKGLPKDLLFKKGEVPTPFPILIDADRSVTGVLGIFQTEWGGGKIAQNIPSVMLVDAEGTLRFKYMGQNTWDRPGYEYLFKQMDCLGWRK